MFNTAEVILSLMSLLDYMTGRKKNFFVKVIVCRVLQYTWSSICRAINRTTIRYSHKYIYLYIVYIHIFFLLYYSSIYTSQSFAMRQRVLASI